MNRKLASVRIVSDVIPIEGADNIELIMVDGWQCVAKKGDFSPKQFCIYFEIDSFLPIRPEFEFLRKSSYCKMGEREGFRLKTIKLRGQISQGLVMKPDSFIGFFMNRKLASVREELPRGEGMILFEEDVGDGNGFDITELLGVLKYERPIPAMLSGTIKGNFPSFIRKTDQERIQNLWRKIKENTETFEITQKLDGTSCTYYLNEGAFGVCSRNLDLLETKENTLWRLARELDIEKLLRKYGKNIALQGEIIGEAIQGNPEQIKGQRFYLFDIWDIDKQEYLRPYERRNTWREFYITFNTFIFHVPLINPKAVLKTYNISDSINQLLLAADGYSLGITGVEKLLDAKPSFQEGLVFKSNDSDLTFKVISNKYLLEKAY